MKYILLDIGLPAASWLGIVTVAVIGLLSWLGKKIIDNVEKENAELKENIKRLTLDLKIEVTKSDSELRKMDNKINDVSKQTDARITDMNINILNKLDAIKDKFYDLRK